MNRMTKMGEGGGWALITVDDGGGGGGKIAKILIT